MNISVMFFASLRESIGTRILELNMPINSTVADLKDFLVRSYPGLAEARNSILVSINREYVGDEWVIPLGGEIAIFPPVSGG
jgi:sulfur-carrier protein